MVVFLGDSCKTSEQKLHSTELETKQLLDIDESTSKFYKSLRVSEILHSTPTCLGFQLANLFPLFSLTIEVDN